jgi:hypothetical protein
MYLKIYMAVDKCTFHGTVIFILLLLSSVEVQWTTKVFTHFCKFFVTHTDFLFSLLFCEISQLHILINL